MIASLRRELRPTLKLAVPLASAELAWMAMGVVDTVMVGPLGPAAIGAVSLGGMIFYTVAICGAGVLYSLDTLVSQSHGAGDSAEGRRWLAAGIWLSLLIAPLATGGMLLWLPLLRAFHTNPEVYAQLEPFLTALAWSVVPYYLYAALRRHLQAVHVVRPLTFAVVSANLVNFAGNWILIYGHWGAPAMGIRGSAWSTCIARAYMLAVIAIAAVRHGAFHGVDWQPRWNRMRRLTALGLPAALQMGAEAGVFALVTAFAAKLDAASMAAHGIALNVISVTYMVPLGVSAAAAVRVGNALGRREPGAAAAAGWTALALGAGFMAAAGAVLFAAPESILRLYTGDPGVIRAGVLLLGIAAMFELFDGTQVVATGALRGAGDTRTPMVTNLLFYWLVGLPVAYALCFGLGWGAPGLWIGLCAALVLIGGTLLAVWRRRTRPRA